MAEPRIGRDPKLLLLSASGVTMASGTKIRRLTRLLDESDAPLWVIGPNGRIIYLSAGCAFWLGVDVESLVDRRSVAGAPVTDDPLDRLAASLSPPPGLAARGTASLRVQPPTLAEQRPESIEVRYIRLGQGSEAITIAVGGKFDDRTADPELQDAVALRQRLDGWRKRSDVLASMVTAGTSASARQMRRRIRVAGSTRTDIGFFGPTGCGSESIALRVHHLSAPAESLILVDGPLMDAELLDATVMPALHQLTESTEATATALVRGLDEMPLEAQQRLVSLIDTFKGRLRLLALCGPRPQSHPDKQDKDGSRTSSASELLGLEDQSPNGICDALVELLSTLTIVCQPLANRVEDIPLIATAMLDSRHAAGEGTAERIGRAALDALVIYPWPRNHDELDQSIRHAVRTAPGQTIGVEHLPLAIRSFRPEDPSGHNAITALDVAVGRYERRLINDAVEASGGNRAEAARRLDISRTRLLRKLSEIDNDGTDEAEENG